MRVLTLSLDPQILNDQSVVASRCVRYGTVLDTYTAIVPTTESKKVSLSSNVVVYGTGGSHKLIQLWNMYRIARLCIKKESCNVISSQDTYFLGLLAWILARSCHIGFEVQVLGIEKLNYVRRVLSYFVLARAGSIRVLSEGLQRRLIDEFKIDSSKMLLVPIYVDVSSLGLGTGLPTQELTDANTVFNEMYSERFNIVSVNRLVPIKNISMQLGAIAELSKEFPDVLLHVVGNGPLQETLEKEIVNLKIEKNVILEGFKSGIDLSPFFTQSDCFVLTSDFEGYGMVVIEAATAGLPIVMTDVGCAGEVIVNEKSGMIVPAKDTQAFIQALRKVRTDSALRASLREEAKHSIAELPSFETILEKYTASWKQALQNRY